MFDPPAEPGNADPPGIDCDIYNMENIEH